MKQITLIRPPILELQSNLSSYGAILPIGLAYIAAILKDAGHQLTVIDGAGEAMRQVRQVNSPIGPLQMTGLSPHEIVDRIPENSELIGISHMFLHEWPTVREIAEQAKKRLPNVPIVIGGENATAFWPYIYKETPAVDYCILGEGERLVLELIKCLESKATPSGMPGIISRTSAVTPPPASSKIQRILQLDTLPRPAWDFFPVENYLTGADHHGVHRGRSLPMLATRGCPFLCTFCSSPQMWGTRYTARQPQEVVNEIKHYVQKYGIQNVNFCDLTAIINREWIIEFCSIIKRDGLCITWQLPTGTRSEALDDEVLKLLYETGCRNITYAPESGSERMLHILKKKVHLSRMLGSLKAAHHSRLVTRVNIIIGHPEEKRSDTWKSLLFLIRAAWEGCDDTAVMIFAPYPGSEDFEKLMAQEKVRMNQDYYYLALARSGWSSRTYNPRMGTKELILMQFFMLLTFYALAYLTRPWRILSALHSLWTGREQTQLDQLLRTKFKKQSPVHPPSAPGAQDNGNRLPAVTH